MIPVPAQPREIFMNAKVNSLRSYHEANKGVVNKGNAYSVPPEALEEEQGFNVRDYEDPDVVQHIRNFADAYARGDYIPPIVVRVEDGKLLVREGHCRRRGLLLAIEEGAQIERTPVVEHKGDEIQQNFLILCSNQGLEIKPLERAEVYRRLKAWGKTEEEIARGVGRSVTHVSQYLQLIQLPVRLKEAIRQNQISSTAALELFQEHGTDAVGMVASALESASKEGRTRITAKHVQKNKRISPAVAASMATHIHRLSERLQTVVDTAAEGETVALQLSLEEARELLAVREKLAQMGAPAAAADSAGATETHVA